MVYLMVEEMVRPKVEEMVHPTVEEMVRPMVEEMVHLMGSPNLGLWVPKMVRMMDRRKEQR